jgi:pyroglutamyl-peptidase
MKILLTGFEPFGESPINPSQELLRCFPDFLLEDTQIEKAILPVDKAKAPADLLGHMHQTQPDAILSLGLAAGRPKISIERIAVNLMDFRMADNAGVKVTDQPIIPGGPAAFFSTLPVRAMHKALQENEIPGELSLTAGAYLCNQIFYTMLHEIAVNDLDIRAGFIHLPALPVQAAVSDKALPSMSLQTQLDALEILLSVLFQTGQT